MPKQKNIVFYCAREQNITHDTKEPENIEVDIVKYRWRFRDHNTNTWHRIGWDIATDRVGNSWLVCDLLLRAHRDRQMYFVRMHHHEGVTRKVMRQVKHALATSI